MTGIFALLLVQCGTERARQRQIARLERAVERGGDQQLVDSLLGQYRQYMADFPDDHLTGGQYAYRGAELALEHARSTQAVALLRDGLRKHYPSARTPDNVRLLGKIYREYLRNPWLADLVFQANALAFPSTAREEPAAAEALEAALGKMQQSVFAADGKSVDYRRANDFVQGAVHYAMILPDNPRTPHWLLQAGETARGVQAYSKALELYAWLSESYPKRPQAAQALFLRAFVEDEHLAQPAKARATYQKFLDRYPRHELAADARQLVEQLERSGADSPPAEHPQAVDR